MISSAERIRKLFCVMCQEVLFFFFFFCLFLCFKFNIKKNKNENMTLGFQGSLIIVPVPYKKKPQSCR